MLQDDTFKIQHYNNVETDKSGDFPIYLLTLLQDYFWQTYCRGYSILLHLIKIHHIYYLSLFIKACSKHTNLLSKHSVTL